MLYNILRCLFQDTIDVSTFVSHLKLRFFTGHILQSSQVYICLDILFIMIMVIHDTTQKPALL